VVAVVVGVVVEDVVVLAVVVVFNTKTVASNHNKSDLCTHRKDK